MNACLVNSIDWTPLLPLSISIMRGLIYNVNVRIHVARLMWLWRKCSRRDRKAILLKLWKKRERWLEAGEEEEEEDERAAAVVVLRLAKKSATSQACHVEILTLTL